MTDNKQYPELPDFETVEQHVYGACHRYVSQDMLEPIHNLIRDGIDADRASRAQAAQAVPDVETLARWKSTVNTLATLSLKAERYQVGAALKQEIADAMNAAAPSAPAAPQPAAPQDEFLPLLARDIANELGTTSINVCEALRTLGFGCFSLNMAITKTMAAKLREHFATHPAEGVPAQGDAEGLRRQHDADSRELRSLCQARDEARRERDLLKVEVVALESSVGHLTRLVDELRPNGERLEWVLRRCSGSWLRARLGVVSDTADMETLTVLIDANRGAAIAQAKESKT